MITNGFLFPSFGVIRAIRICFLAKVVANCKKEKKNLENCKAVRKERGKIIDECSSKEGFLEGANVSISS
jgi:hypothetical protein